MTDMRYLTAVAPIALALTPDLTPPILQPQLVLDSVGDTGVTEGFAALPQVTSYTATAGRFRRAQGGFVRCAANEERLCYNSDGTFRGQYLQGADTYYSAPWDDPAAPHTSSDPAYLAPREGGSITYAGGHTEADIFGGTGGGVLIEQTDTDGSFHVASAIAPTVSEGDVLRFEMIVSLDGVTTAGKAGLRGANNLNFAFEFDHDASGNITGFTDTWSTTRAGYHDMGTINGKRWWYLWCDRVADASGTEQQPGFSFSTTVDGTGNIFHLCDLMLRVNPATPPAAVPVCAAAKTFAADTLATEFSGAGYVCNGLAMARSQMTSGAIVPPAVNIGVPYEPLETRIDIITATETADRSGIIANENLLLYSTPWRNPANFQIYYGPTRIQRDWIITQSSRNCVNATVAPVFKTRRDKRPILGNISTSQTHLTGVLTVDDNIFLASGDASITKWFEQVDNPVGSAANFALISGGGVSAKRCLVIGSTPDITRARYSIQKDRNRHKQPYCGVWQPRAETNGGVVNDSGSRFQYLSRRAPGSGQSATTLTVTSNDVMALDMWSDPVILGAGTYPFEMRRCFFGHTTSYDDLYLAQSQREIHISTDGGTTFEPFSTSGFTIQDLPHGAQATYVGSYDPATDTVSYGSAADKGPLKIRYFESGSVTSPLINRTGYQWHGSQMDMGDHTRYPSNCDVFRTAEEVGPSGVSMILEVVYQSGQWQTGNNWVDYVGAAIGNPSLGATGTHPDFLQINRTDVNIDDATIADNVMVGPAQGPFLTGSSALGPTGSELDNFNVSGMVLINNTVNGFSWDWSKTDPANATLGPNVLMVQAEKVKPFSLNDGSSGNLVIRTNGTNNVLTIAANSDVTLVTASTSLLGGESGATFDDPANINRIATAARSNFTTYTRPPSDDDLNLVPAEWRKANGRIVLPESSDDARAFRFASDIATRVGFDANAIIETALGDHAEWDEVAERLYQQYLNAPDQTVETVNTASVGAVLATGLTGTGFHATEGGNEERLYEIVGGQLRVAKALTGLDRIDVLLTDADELIVVDITT